MCDEFECGDLKELLTNFFFYDNEIWATIIRESQTQRLPTSGKPWPFLGTNPNESASTTVWLERQRCRVTCQRGLVQAHRSRGKGNHDDWLNYAVASARSIWKPRASKSLELSPCSASQQKKGGRISRPLIVSSHGEGFVRCKCRIRTCGEAERINSERRKSPLFSDAARIMGLVEGRQELLQQPGQ
jgi:hypothetical protein